MKICIYGAGAIGGLLGVRLAKAGEEVTLIARGPHLEAMRKNGVTLHSGGETFVAHPHCTDDPEAVGVQDFVIVTLKAHSLPPIVSQMRPLLGEGTAVVNAMNGVPWWYFYKLSGPWQDKRVASVDPDGCIWETIGPERAIGCVVYPACTVIAPGVIAHEYGDRFLLGEPDGSRSERCLTLSTALGKAGFKAPVRTEIRNEIWVKLWGNLSFNPISALTGATLEEIATSPDTQPVVRRMMGEAQAIAERLGVTFAIDLDKRIAGAAAVGPHKTSMLQDLEAGRTLEIDALVGAVQELGRLVDVPTPAIDTVLGLVRQRARLAGCLG
ncbi:2-dehydropantoate 2-reductase [Gloeobacter kilaueensis]|uniref:2-dehydropantoate 2-reductase n=1 Tax=Gloeobacter kilaueensis (strain ATCC BAA-2537 / CCAP 1431/1 / ULC 316 / JS1) TaxID=1183438 RepID=U5QFI1_GLOK1|nr:2-dehydropantoate 2-reductase [Gloeobacter kilaueensis]AGY56430.1 2-dehydropantoate 2-reductase [Gloeobacter kilaueensis JS1]